MISSAPLASNSAIQSSLESLLRLRSAGQRLDLTNFKKVKTLYSGLQRSSLRGRGIEFTGVRSYEAGDDIRHIDWRVTARTGKTHTKLFCEDRDRPVFVLVDYRSSMLFGTRKSFKSVVAAEAAALVAWSAIQQGDRIGGIIFSDKNLEEFKPQTGNRGILPLLQALAKKPCHEGHEAGGLTSCLLHLRRIIRPGSLVFIFSDFLGLDEDAEQSLCQLSQHNSLVGAFISDPLEVSPPPPNYYSITDGTDIKTLDTSSKVLRRAYQARYLEHFATTEKMLSQYGIPLRHFSTDTWDPFNFK